MVITQELYSRNGEVKSKKILNVISLKKMDNVILPYTRHQAVIWVNQREYPIICRAIDIRDEIYKTLSQKLIDGETEVTLSLENFYKNRLSPKQIEDELSSYSMAKYLYGCLSRLANSTTATELKQLDAFVALSNNRFKKIKNKEPQIFKENEIHVFTKTLPYPKKFHDYITPYTFWGTINRV